MKTKKMQNVTWWIMGVLILGLSVALVSCDSDSDSSVTSSQVSVTDLISFSAQNEDGVASGKLYGAYYSAGDGSFRISILQTGDYRVSYTTGLGTFYLVVRVNNSAVMDLGLTKLEDGSYDKLSSVCIASGTAELPDEVQESGPVTYYPEGGVATSPSIFTSNGNSVICVIQNGAVVESDTVALLPAPSGSSSSSGTGTGTGTTPTDPTYTFHASIWWVEGQDVDLWTTDGVSGQETPKTDGGSDIYSYMTFQTYSYNESTDQQDCGTTQYATCRTQSPAERFDGTIAPGDYGPYVIGFTINTGSVVTAVSAPTVCVTTSSGSTQYQCQETMSAGDSRDIVQLTFTASGISVTPNPGASCGAGNFVQTSVGSCP